MTIRHSHIRPGGRTTDTGNITIGALWMVLACLTLAILTGLVRQASQTIDVFEIVFFRNLIGVILLAPMLFRGGIPSALRQRWPLFASRGIISFAAILTWFYALAHVPLADAVTLNFTLPLFATVLAALILHETVHVRRWTATVVGFLGAVIVLRPGFSEVGSGAIAALGSAAFMAMSMTMVKIMSRIDKPSTIVLWSNLVMTPLSLVPALFVWTWPTATDAFWLLAIGAVAVIAQICLSRAYAAAEASAILPFDFTRLPFAALVGYVFFDEIPDLWTWTGAAIIIASAIYIARREAALGKRLTAERHAD